MSQERYMLRGELEEIKERLSVLYYQLKDKTTALYQKAYEITSPNLSVYPEEIQRFKEIVDEIANTKQEIKALEERAEYLKRKLKEV